MPAGSSSSSSRSGAMPFSVASSRIVRPVLKRLLGQRRGGVVADLGRERRSPASAPARRAAARARWPSRPRPAAPGSCAPTPRAARSTRAARRAVTGSMTLSSRNEPGLAERDGRVVADHPGDDHGQALDDDRVHLARHDRRPRLGLGQRELGEAGARAHAHEPDVGGDLPQAERDRADPAVGGDHRVERRLRVEVVGGLADRQTGQLREADAGTRRVLGVGVDPGPDRRAAQRARRAARRGPPGPAGSPPRPGPRSPRTPGRAGSASRPGGACGRS